MDIPTKIYTNRARPQHTNDVNLKRLENQAAIPGQHLSALISMGYIFGFRKDNAIFFNGLGQNYPDRVSPKRLCH